MGIIGKHIIPKINPEHSFPLLFSYSVGMLSALILFTSLDYILPVRSAAAIVLLTLLVSAAHISSLPAAVVMPILTAVVGFASASLSVRIVDVSAFSERVRCLMFLLISVPFQFVVGAVGLDCSKALKAALSASGKNDLIFRQFFCGLVFFLLSLPIASAIVIYIL